LKRVWSHIKGHAIKAVTHVGKAIRHVATNASKVTKHIRKAMHYGVKALANGVKHVGSKVLGYMKKKAITMLIKFLVRTLDKYAGHQKFLICPAFRVLMHPSYHTTISLETKTGDKTKKWEKETNVIPMNLKQARVDPKRGGKQAIVLKVHYLGTGSWIKKNKPQPACEIEMRPSIRFCTTCCCIAGLIRSGAPAQLKKNNDMVGGTRYQKGDVPIGCPLILGVADAGSRAIWGMIRATYTSVHFSRLPGQGIGCLA